jgi:hypothetical protein
MPVIRGISKSASLTSERRKVLRDELIDELTGKSSTDGPLIFEIPLEQSDKIDVIVVWNAFDGVRAEDSTGLILDAYSDRKVEISLAMGVTYHEAVAQHLLPYTVVPMMKRGQVEPAALNKAMMEEGGVALSNGKVELRFPTMAMAEEAHQRLSERLPEGYWSILETIGQVP